MSSARHLEPSTLLDSDFLSGKIVSKEVPRCFSWVPFLSSAAALKEVKVKDWVRQERKREVIRVGTDKLKHVAWVLPITI